MVANGVPRCSISCKHRHIWPTCEKEDECQGLTCSWNSSDVNQTYTTVFFKSGITLIYNTVWQS